MTEREGDAALTPYIRSQNGGGARLYEYCTLAVTNGSSINSNTASSVGHPAYILASGLVVGLPM